MKRYDFFINGRPGHDATTTDYPVYDKADQSVITRVPDATEADVDAAVAAAVAAQPGWRALAPVERGRLLYRLAEKMDAAAAALSPAFGRETGLASDALVRAMPFHAGLVRFYAGIADKPYGRVLQDEDGPLNYTIREPLGVVACMLAWNTPLGSFTQKVAPALAAGNTVVVRAPDEAPLTVLALGELVSEAGFPPGVLNLICGLGGRSGSYLAGHPNVAGVSFTGSVTVGRAIAVAAAPTFKRTVLELGGKSPALIFADADIDRAADRAVEAAFGYQGQGCSAVSRVLIEKSVYPRALERMKAKVEGYRAAIPGQAVGSGPVIGPLFNRRQLERTLEFVDLARREARLITGGQRALEQPFDRGYYVLPALVEVTDRRSRLFMEEIFGPVLSVTPFHDEAEACALANTCNYALSGSVWSLDVDKARRVARTMKFGTVWINDHLRFSHHAPWGGYKNSGWGREFGIDAVNSFTEVKSVWLRG